MNILQKILLYHIAFPYLWVNGEKYIFSNEVLESGKRLFNSFCKIQHVIRNVYTRACQDNTNNSSHQIRSDLGKALDEFDINWVAFEQVQNSLFSTF